MNQIRGQGAPVLLVDGGDCLFSSPTLKAPPAVERLRDLRTARQILGAYNAMGYQALGVGPAELQHGLPALKELAGKARFPFLCANLVSSATEEPVFEPYTIVEVAGLRIGIYAVILDSLHESFVERVLPGCKVLDAAETTREIVEELRGRCDLLLALSHLNVDQNEKIVDSRPGIDILIDPLSKNGSKALWVEADDYCTIRNGTFVLRVDGQGSRMGVFEMYFAEGSKKPSGYRGYDVPLEPHILRHPETTEALARYAAESSDLETLDFDPSKPRLVEDFLGADGCGGCHEEQLRFWKGTKHATAIETLEKSGDRSDPACFVCHSYGYGVTFVDPAELRAHENVQCESCHGMKPGHAASPREARLGSVEDATCYACHNPSITQMPFQHSEVWERTACPKMKR